MLKLTISSMLKNKGISKSYVWLIKIGIPHDTCHKILNNKTVRLSMKHIDKICEQAWCTPNDLFEWTPSTPLIDQANHPMQKLKARAIVDINTHLKKLTPEQIKQANDIVSAMANENKTLPE